MTERVATVTLEIAWDDEHDDHPLQWDWEFLLCTKINRIRVVDPEGDGWPKDES